MALEGPGSPAPDGCRDNGQIESLRQTRLSWGPQGPFLLVGSPSPCFSGLSLQPGPHQHTHARLLAHSFLRPSSTGHLHPGATQTEHHRRWLPTAPHESIALLGEKVRARPTGPASSHGSGAGSVLLVLLATPGSLGPVDTPALASAVPRPPLHVWAKLLPS